MELEHFAWLLSFQLGALHYSYMELELAENVTKSITFDLITLFLYGIGAICSCCIAVDVFRSITLFLYGIGAIFCTIQSITQYLITLFLYGIGAHFCGVIFTLL